MTAEDIKIGRRIYFRQHQFVLNASTPTLICPADSNRVGVSVASQPNGLNGFGKGYAVSILPSVTDGVICTIGPANPYETLLIADYGLAVMVPLYVTAFAEAVNNYITVTELILTGDPAP